VAAEASAETFTALMDHVAEGFSAKAYLVLRQAFGGTLLLGLEVLVAADLVRAVAVARLYSRASIA
jgi:uncharacterized membrane protein